MRTPQRDIKPSIGGRRVLKSRETANQYQIYKVQPLLKRRTSPHLRYTLIGKCENLDLYKKTGMKYIWPKYISVTVRLSASSSAAFGTHINPQN